MSKQLMNTGPMGLLATLLIFLVASGATVENRPAAQPVQPTSAQRKPPFNGSIFGKRSVLPALPQVESMMTGPGSMGYPSMGQQQQPQDDYSQQQLDLTAELLSLLGQQQEALIRTSMELCLAQQRASGSESSVANSLRCAEILASQQQQQQKDQFAFNKRQDTNTWLSRIAAAN